MDVAGTWSSAAGVLRVECFAAEPAGLAAKRIAVTRAKPIHSVRLGTRFAVLGTLYYTSLYETSQTR